jgi:cytochrome c-type biogenesis protein CcmE
MAGQSVMTAKNKPRQRLRLILICAVVLSAAAVLSAYGLRSYATYFHSPSDLANNPPAPQLHLRIGGLVVEGSLKQNNEQPPQYAFSLTDGKAQVDVIYNGLLPDMFRDNQGIVAEGTLPDPAKPFQADRILAKHDEYYMPREVERSLKK